MSAPEVIDLCSDDSDIGLSQSNARHFDENEPITDKSAASYRPINRKSVLNEIDLELELEDLLPSRATKRRRIERSPEHAGTSSNARLAPSGHGRPPLILTRPIAPDVNDPISSSQPCDLKAARESMRLDQDLDFFDGAATSQRRSPGISQTTASLLAEISVNAGKKTAAVKPMKKAAMLDGSDEEDAPSTTLTKEQLTSIRKAAQVARKVEKEEAKAAVAEQKRLERERKAMEKELAANHAEANKGRHDKKISTPEMIVDVHTSMLTGHMHTELKKLLGELSVELATHGSRSTNVIKWRRKSKTVFNTELKHWELRPEVILDEPQVCCICTAQDFVKKAGSAELQTHIKEVKSEFPACKILYIIEGLDSYLKKQRNQKNRAYLAAARQDVNDSSSKATPSNASVDEDAIEDILVELPLTHGISIFHTVNALETAEWISDLTQHISTVPYKKERSNLDSQFCMDTGQVKAGEDARDVYVRALQQVVRVTAPIAYGIAAEYGDVPSLIRAFRTRGDLALEDIQKHVNRDGTASSARVGPQISRRLAKVFTSLDPDSMDI